MILLDNGHGENTPGKRSPVWSDGSQLLEWEFNRAITYGIYDALKSKYSMDLIVPHDYDVSLSDRVMIANIYGKNNLLISVHANAGGGTGFEAFTSPGETKSDQIATLFYDAFTKEFPDKRARKDLNDGDPDKESRFTIITKTIMPAVLTENFFMDNEQECRQLLMTSYGREKIINYHIEAIEKAAILFPELF
jgi:N-acetylmuramoyl-L-alanine amidase